MQNLSGLIQFAADDTIQATFNGSIYRKQLAKFGEWVNPQYPGLSSSPIMTLDEAWAEKIVENFNKNTLGAPVPVPLNHTNDAKANTGRVQSLDIVPGDGLYGNLIISDADTVGKLDRGEIFDVSISFDWNHVRTDDNKNYGPTLLHVALVNNPYLLEMNSFEKVGPALSKLEETLKAINLSQPGRDVIMLSRDRVKELSKMATRTIKNDKGFAITVKFTEDGEEKELVIPAGEEATVPEDVADDVTTQIADAQDSAGDAGTDGDAGDGDGTDGDAGTGDTTPPANETEQEELSRLRLENAELQLSKEYDSLLAEGKVIPAQKDKIMALAKLPQATVQLSKDAEPTSVTSIVLDVLRAGKPQFSTDETGNGEGKPEEKKTEGTEGKKPSELLSADDLAGLEATGHTPEELDKLAAEDPAYAKALAELSAS